MLYSSPDYTGGPGALAQLLPPKLSARPARALHMHNALWVMESYFGEIEYGSVRLGSYALASTSLALDSRLASHSHAKSIPSKLYLLEGFFLKELFLISGEGGEERKNDWS